MKRYFLILLLVLLPLQFSWAIAGAYCAHEEGPAPHFGHHVHKHDKANDGVKKDDVKKDDLKHEAKKVQVDTDCEYCHHVPTSAIFPTDPALAPPGLAAHTRYDGPRYLSHIPDLIPRPDWPVLA